MAVGLLGAGQFASGTLLPAMKKVSGIEFVGVCSSTGLSARQGAEKFGFRYCTTDEHEIVTDLAVNTVVIATRHHLHARQVLAALGAGKHVFCEKPLCLTESELRDIVVWYVHDGRDCARPLLMVGYNRRFAPLARRLKDAFRQVGEPLAMHYLVNAGALPLDHWVHDPTQGGGRLVGEVCHFVDLLTFLAGSLPVRAQIRALPNADRYRDDNLIVVVEFANQSLSTITYVANGDKRFPKERLEVFGGGIVGVLDDFRGLELLANGRRRVSRSFFSRDKGHKAEWHQFVGAVRQGGPLPISFEELVSASLVTLRLAEALQTGQPVSIDTEEFIASARVASSDPGFTT